MESLLFQVITRYTYILNKTNKILSFLVGLLTALWYGSVADRYIQCLVLMLSLSGGLLALLWMVSIYKFLR